MTEDRLAELMVKATDDVATRREMEELMAYALEHPQVRRELEAHRALRAVTDGWVDRLSADLAEDRHRSSGAFRLERLVGTMLLIVGSLVLAGFGTLQFWLDPEVPLWVSSGVTMLAVGSIVLLISAIRWRLSTRAEDPYSEVIR